jgi:hypothetical protein
MTLDVQPKYLHTWEVLCVLQTMLIVRMCSGYAKPVTKFAGYGQ